MLARAVTATTPAPLPSAGHGPAGDPAACRWPVVIPAYNSSGGAAADDRFAALRTDGYGVDAELLLLARRRSYRTIETPVNWAEPPGLKVSVLRHGPGVLAEILLVRWRLGRGSRDAVRA